MSHDSSDVDLDVRSRMEHGAPAKPTPPDRDGACKSFYEMARDALNDTHQHHAHAAHGRSAPSEADRTEDNEDGEDWGAEGLGQRAEAAAWAASMSKGALHAVSCVRRVEEIRRLTVEHTIGRDGGVRCRVEIDLVPWSTQERNM